MMYRCHEIKEYYSDIFTREINEWFEKHPNAELINISIVHDGITEYYHAFITWADKPED